MSPNQKATTNMWNSVLEKCTRLQLSVTAIAAVALNSREGTCVAPMTPEVLLESHGPVQPQIENKPGLGGQPGTEEPQTPLGSVPIGVKGTCPAMRGRDGHCQITALHVQGLPAWNSDHKLQ